MTRINKSPIKSYRCSDNCFSDEVTTPKQCKGFDPGVGVGDRPRQHVMLGDVTEIVKALD